MEISFHLLYTKCFKESKRYQNIRKELDTIFWFLYICSYGCYKKNIENQNIGPEQKEPYRFRNGDLTVTNLRPYR